MTETMTETMTTESKRYSDHIRRLTNEMSAALEANHYDALIIHAGQPVRRSRFDDQYYNFIPTPSFTHIAPITTPHSAIELRVGGDFKLYRPSIESFWETPAPPPAGFILEHLYQTTSPKNKRSGRVAFIGNDESAATEWGIETNAINPPPLVAALDAIRTVKSAYEVDNLARANKIAAHGHAAIGDAFANGGELDAKGHSEFELHLLYLRTTGQDDTETPYKNIVALNQNAAILHHINYQRKTADATQPASLLIDAGAMVNGYAADVTRTYIRGIRGTDKSQDNGGAELFSTLLTEIETMQQTICAQLKPGASFEALHDQTHERLAQILCDLEIAQASPDELISSGATRAFLPHGLGHSLGIQVHDVGCKIRPPATRNPFLRNTATVTVGQVFTIEPGCYFIDSLLEPLRQTDVGKRLNWQLIGDLAHFGGIRIEDNIYMADGETRNLTRDNWPSSP